MVEQPMPETTCPICGGTGWKIIERSGLTGAERCECAAAARARAIQENTRIPPKYADATLENFEIPQDNPTARNALGTVFRQVRRFADDFPFVKPPGLLLVGDTGTGKTHLAVAVLKVLAKKGHECLFFDYQDLLERIRNSYDSSSGTGDRDAYRSVLDAEVVLLDELGAYRMSDWVEDTITGILTYRCNHQKATLITTNLPDPSITGSVVDKTTPGGIALYKKQLQEVIGMRGRSRLFEMCRLLSMPAVQDYRIKTARLPRG